MRKLRVVIVDGDPSLRRKIGRALEGEDGVDVVGASCLGPLAVEKVRRLEPDLVILGVNPTESEAWETLGLLRAERPGLSIVVASPEARRGSPLAIDALNHGATGCMTLESDPSLPFHEELIPKVRMWVRTTQDDARPPAESMTDRPLATSVGRIEAVVIGSSTRGRTGWRRSSRHCRPTSRPPS